MRKPLAAGDLEALRTFSRFYEARRASIGERTRSQIMRTPEWGPARQRADPAEVVRADEHAYQLQTGAILRGEWAPYLELLRTQGGQYAEAGLSYDAWLDMLGTYRDVTRDELQAFLLEDPEHNSGEVFEIGRGLNRLLDLIAAEIADAYLAAKERKLASSDERYRVLFERSPQPMWTFDRDTLRFITVNDAAIRHYGYSREEFLAMTLADIRRSDDAEAVRAAVGRGLTSGDTWQHRKKDGTEITVEIHANDFELDGVRARLVLVNDVTERLRTEASLRRTEEQLRHTQKMDAIGRLAGSVAHDFNNLLTVIQSYACMLEDAIEPTDSRHADASEIRRTSERAAAVTKQLLTLSRHSVVAPRSVHVDEIVLGFQPLLRRLVGDAIAVSITRGGVPTVTIDPGQLEQVLMNLAVNARDAMPNGGRIAIATRTVEVDEGRHVEIAVTDTGHGMDPETMSRIFEPFFTTKPAGQGTGLGLAIVHGIVSQAGGAVSVYSEVGRGTTFRIRLPVNELPIAAAERAATAAPLTLPPLRVLVVDDHPNVRAVAARVLKDAGCQVLEASTAQEARRLCVNTEDPIDVTVLDIVLPDGGGDELIRQLHEIRPAMKVVQMSGYPGAHVLAKPFSPSELRGAIARVVGPDAAAAGSPDVKDAAARVRRRALIVDDDDDFRRVITRLLTKSGFEAVEVDSGFKAIEMLDKEPFDVVLSDVQMPDGGGLDLLRAIRRVDLDVPVLLMTGAPSVAAAAAAVEYGAFRYLTKPLDTAALVKTVDHAARAHALARLRREAFNVSGTHAGVADRAGLEVRFEQAIEGLWLAFQPIVHASSGTLYGVEALMRTSEPSMPHPGAVLDAATHLGRLPLLGRRIRALAGEALADRADQIALFVNLHPDDLLDANLVDQVAPLTAIASRVVLEVTERSSLDSSPALSERIARLRKLGFKLAVDDIGAGYSGLTSFTELTPEIVKIDMSLVRDVHTSALKQRTIGALCRLCHEVGTLVVGEGVETLEERDALVDLGCDLLQGYLIGKPKRELPVFGLFGAASPV